MSRQRFLQAALAGLSLAVAAAPTGAPAQNLTVLQGTEQAPIDVPLNRAVVVESDVPFTELSIANPGIADISSLSDRSKMWQRSTRILLPWHSRSRNSGGSTRSGSVRVMNWRDAATL